MFDDSRNNPGSPPSVGEKCLIKHAVRATMSVLIGAFLSNSAFATPPPNAPQEHRLALWVTKSIALADANECNPDNVGTLTTLPTTAPTLTDNEIIAWDSHTALWTIDLSNFAKEHPAKSIHDHCFVLAIDGEHLASGVILSSYSARLIRFPLLNVHVRSNVVKLQLTSGNDKRPISPIHVDALDTILWRKAGSANSRKAIWK